MQYQYKYRAGYRVEYQYKTAARSLDTLAYGDIVAATPALDTLPV